MQSLPAIQGGDLPDVAQRLTDRLHAQRAELVEFDQSPATARAYVSRLFDFVKWYMVEGLPLHPYLQIQRTIGHGKANKQTSTLPAPEMLIRPGVVELYIGYLADAGRKISTIQQSLAALKAAHSRYCADDIPSPTESALVRRAMRQLRRKLGTAQVGKAPVSYDDLWNMLDGIPNTGLANLRDRAILAVGWYCALRRSEVVDLKCGDIKKSKKGYTILIRKSKTDQHGEGQTVALPFGNGRCPVSVLEAWRKAAGIRRGFIFRRMHKGGTVTQFPVGGQPRRADGQNGAGGHRAAPGLRFQRPQSARGIRYGMRRTRRVGSEHHEPNAP